MHQPYLITALYEAKRRQCPCGAVAEHPRGLCRKCQARMAWRRKTTTRTSRRGASRRRLAKRHARSLARLANDAMSLPRTTASKGDDN